MCLCASVCVVQVYLLVKERKEAGHLRNVFSITSSPSSLQLCCTILCVLLQHLCVCVRVCVWGGEGSFCSALAVLRLATSVLCSLGSFVNHHTCAQTPEKCENTHTRTHTTCFYFGDLFAVLFITDLKTSAKPHTHSPTCGACPGQYPCAVRISAALRNSRAVTNSVVLYAALLSAGCLIKLSAEQLKTLLPFSPNWLRRKRSKLNSVRPLGLKSDGRMAFADSVRSKAVRRGHRWCSASPDINLTV